MRILKNNKLIFWKLKQYKVFWSKFDQNNQRCFFLRDFILNLRKKSKKKYVPSENYNATTEASNNAKTINHLNFRGTRIAGSNSCTKWSLWNESKTLRYVIFVNYVFPCVLFFTYNYENIKYSTTRYIFLMHHKVSTI